MMCRLGLRAYLLSQSIEGVGAVLVRAIEDHARQRHFSRLYLYTTEAVGFYERLSWEVLDRTSWKGFDTALMVRDL